MCYECEVIKTFYKIDFLQEFSLRILLFLFYNERKRYSVEDIIYGILGGRKQTIRFALDELRIMGIVGKEKEIELGKVTFYHLEPTKEWNLWIKTPIKLKIPKTEARKISNLSELI